MKEKFLKYGALVLIAIGAVMFFISKQSEDINEDPEPEDINEDPEPEDINEDPEPEVINEDPEPEVKKPEDYGTMD